MIYNNRKFILQNTKNKGRHEMSQVILSLMFYLKKY
jgi:hypothetical protein